MKDQKDYASLRLSYVNYRIWSKNKGNLKSVLTVSYFAFLYLLFTANVHCLWLSVVALRDRLWLVLLSNLKISEASFEQRGVVLFQKLLIQTFLDGYFIG